MKKWMTENEMEILLQKKGYKLYDETHHMGDAYKLYHNQVSCSDRTDVQLLIAQGTDVKIIESYTHT